MASGHPINVLIDPSFLNPFPFHLIPRALRFYHGATAENLIGRLGGNAIGCLPRWAFGPEGFDGVDLGFAFTTLLAGDLSIREGALHLYRQAGWPIMACHATFEKGSRFFADTELELTLRDERTARGLRNQILLASSLGGPGTILVIHMGRVKESRAKDIGHVIRLLDSQLPLAEEKGILLAVENMPRNLAPRPHLGSDYRDLQEVLRALPSRSLKVCLDWGHANNYAEVFALETGRKPLEGYLHSFGYCREIIEELGDAIVYAHIHYNRSHVLRGEAARRDFDEHMPLVSIPTRYWGAFCRTISLLIKNSAIVRTGRIQLELLPRSFFGVYRVREGGSQPVDQMRSLRLLREILEREVPGG